MRTECFRFKLGDRNKELEKRIAAKPRSFSLTNCDLRSRVIKTHEDDSFFDIMCVFAGHFGFSSRRRPGQFAKHFSTFHSTLPNKVSRWRKLRVVSQP